LSNAFEPGSNGRESSEQRARTHLHRKTMGVEGSLRLITWHRIKQIADDWLPQPKILLP